MVDRAVLDKISVLNDRILLIPSEPKTRSGIIIPEGSTQGETVRCGYIIKKGKGYPLVKNNGSDDEKVWEKKAVAIETAFIPLSVSVGDFIYFLDQRSINIRHDGYDFVVIPESSIMMVVKMDDSIENILSKVGG